MKIIRVITYLFLLGISTINAQKKKNIKPNIILIYADDLGRGMLGNYGQKYLTTPNIDKLADKGMRFNNVYGCQFCAPARASLISGMHDAHMQPWSLTKAGIYVKEAKEINLEEIYKKIDKVSKPAKENEIFLGTVAQKQGYTTAEFGKLEWGFATTAQRVKSHGWDYHFGYYDHVRCHGFFPPFLFENGKLVEIPGNTRIDCGKTFESESPENYKERWDMTGKVKYSEDIFIEKMLGFIDENNPKKTDRPFFIYYPTQLPHGPISVPAVDPELKNNPNLTEFEKEYGTMVKLLDESVGKIYHHLDKLGILDNTIIVFTGDNGHEVYTKQEGKTENTRSILGGGKFDNITTKYYSDINGDIFDGNDGMAGLKRDNWEGGVRVPMYWYWKDKIKGGTESNQLIANYDILNTISELIGGKNYDEKDSKSYAKTLLGGKSEEHEYTVYASNLGPAIVTKEGWKLRYQKTTKIFQLYFLPDDYREEKVLNDKYPKKVKKLTALLIKECDGDLENGSHAVFVRPEVKNKKK
ncbi:arylsulfatase A-like enzyme [Wenyingzhuangia heitensis]|uniref:Arylsulfatase A-like enzyme n=1 Tax=Wenyingzhuangia heitensis TaxID=1487859 RepID=A0ABX0UGM0_9FLAO|nr:sulfatase-like hydrolase/transferase [Wenyingzhuangia heitensis]NIJ46541.1 arylsulfatase A-like enzyme [Wenyingzhuangia heitensis]